MNHLTEMGKGHFRIIALFFFFFGQWIVELIKLKALKSLKILF